MKFVTFRTAGDVRVGLVEDGTLFDLTAVAASVPDDTLSADSRKVLAHAQERVPVSPFSSMVFLLNAWDLVGDDLFGAVSEFVTLIKEEKLPKEGGPYSRKEIEIDLLAPIPRPSSLRDGYAFRQHVETMRKNRGVEMIPEFDEFPVFYFGNHQAIFGPGEFPVQEKHLAALDFELEAGIVVGRGGRNLKAENADEHIFGLCIMNDMSARALQREEMKLSLGPAKGKDFGTVLGPYLVTRDSLKDVVTSTPAGDQYNLRMTAQLNGKPLSDGNMNTMTWTFAQILERASYGVTLQPGDVIGSGTVGTGCLAELNSSGITDNLWLKPGDTISLEIERLGILENEIVLAAG